MLFDSPSYNHLPVLNGMTRQPYLRPDGSLTMAAGYDAATGMFGVFDAREFAVPERPTRVQAEAALAVLTDLLTEFSFAGDTDLAAALVALLTAAVRPSLPHAPMFHARAHMVGSGKSYLCELITAFATPQRGTPTTFPADDEECRKLLLAEFLRAPAVIEFDNLTGDLVAHRALCTALTSEHITGRILGVSKTATVSTRALFLSSGNNVGPVQDMARRCITIHLAPQCEVPAAREFQRPELVREVLRERGRYVSAALTIVRAWIVAGRPKTSCKALGRFRGLVRPLSPAIALAGSRRSNRIGVPGDGRGPGSRNAGPPLDRLAIGLRQRTGDGARRDQPNVALPRQACRTTRSPP